MKSIKEIILDNPREIILIALITLLIAKLSFRFIKEKEKKSRERKVLIANQVTKNNGRNFNKD